MKVNEYKDYNAEFPETFAWGRIESISLTNAASAIVNEINHDLRTNPDRTYTPGLRRALNCIAAIANL